MRKRKEKKSKMSEQTNQISKESLEEMKKETFELIHQFCNKEKLSDNKYELYLHNSTYIKFTKFGSTEIERFVWLVKRYANVINTLIQKMSYESEIQYAERENITGSIDFEKTRILRQTGSPKLVCIEYSKNLFTYENVLLAAVLLGINAMATKFLEKRAEWKDDMPEKVEGQVEELNNIISYTDFLQKDRNVSKLTKYYYQNFQGIEQLLEKTLYRIMIGKINTKYHALLKFIKIWKRYDQILNEDDNGLVAKLSSLEDFTTGDRIYETWIFYKMLKLFFGNEPVEQKNKHEFTKGKYTIEYQFSKKIGWRRVGGREYDRRPDTAIKKDGKVIAVIDAKYMAAPDIKKEEEESGNTSVRSPKTQIVNQMIIAMDYGDEITNLGIVLFADDGNQESVVIEKIQDHKKIHFLKMHPENSPLDTLDKVGEIIGLKRMPNS